MRSFTSPKNQRQSYWYGPFHNEKLLGVLELHFPHSIFNEVGDKFMYMSYIYIYICFLFIESFVTKSV